MADFSAELLEHFRVATGREVRSWSYGAIERPRATGVSAWDQVRRTLDDQAIFGPTRDFACGCGKFVGKKFERMICDRCGVLVTTVVARRVRFAHIDLRWPVQHPLAGSRVELDAFPVLPASYFTAWDGTLAAAYDAAITANELQSADELVRVIDRIVNALVTPLLHAYRRNSPEAITIGRGMALECIVATSGDDELCAICGYPISGLDSEACPGCGRKIRS